MGFINFANRKIYPMIIHEGYENLKLIAPAATLGIFDGVHRGHRVLLDFLVARAKETDCESVVITFSPHPRLVLDQSTGNLTFLTTLEEKKSLLAKAGINHLIVIEFTRQFSNITACDFITDILIGKIGVRQLIIGYDHHFGRKGEGDFNTIKKCSEDLDFSVDQVPAYVGEDGVISSSVIRQALLNGRLDEANRWLGYSYSVSGNIIEGRRIGRSIGFPTANIKPDSEHKLIPGTGVYAVKVQIDDKIYTGMLSIGSNPTVNTDPSVRSIEVHIIDFDKDIYGKRITVSFIKRLRDEKKFGNLQQLKEQMSIDRQDTMKMLS
jgi:riboflavin kinase / FMN adenylyltransferase